MFLCISFVKGTEMLKVRSSTKHILNPCCPNGIRGKMTIFLFSHLFLVPEKMKPFWRTTKRSENETFLAHHKEERKWNLSDAPQRGAEIKPFWRTTKRSENKTFLTHHKEERKWNLSDAPQRGAKIKISHFNYFRML